MHMIMILTLWQLPCKHSTLHQILLPVSSKCITNKIHISSDFAIIFFNVIDINDCYNWKDVQSNCLCMQIEGAVLNRIKLEPTSLYPCEISSCIAINIWKYGCFHQFQFSLGNSGHFIDESIKKILFRKHIHHLSRKLS